MWTNIRCPNCDVELPEYVCECANCGRDHSSLAALTNPVALQYNEAVKLARAGDFDQAIDLLRPLADGPDGYPEVLILLGKLEAQTNALSEAREHLKSAIELTPDHEEAACAYDAVLKTQRRKRQLRVTRGILMGVLATTVVGVALRVNNPWRQLATKEVEKEVVVTQVVKEEVEVEKLVEVEVEKIVEVEVEKLVEVEVEVIVTPGPGEVLGGVANKLLQRNPQTAQVECELPQQIGPATVKILCNFQSFDEVTSVRDVITASESIDHVDFAHSTVPYLVQTGDTLSKIAFDSYGDASLWPVISRENSVDGDQIYPEQSLQIPVEY